MLCRRRPSEADLVAAFSHAIGHTGDAPDSGSLRNDPLHGEGEPGGPAPTTMPSACHPVPLAGVVVDRRGLARVMVAPDSSASPSTQSPSRTFSMP